MRYVANAEGNRIGVEGRIRKGQRLGIATDPFDGGFAFLFGAAHPLAQHLLVDVTDGDCGLAAPAARQIDNAKSDIAGAARHIQCLPGGLRVQPFHHRILPDAVDAGAHQVVHQVVARRHRGKDLFDQAFLVGLWHVAETETGGFLSHAGNIAAPRAIGYRRRPRPFMTSPCPSYPEVETVRLGLLPVMEGHVLTDVETRRGDLRIPFPRDFVARTKGRKVKTLRRRAKYLLADLDSGETLVIHLGMSGRMCVFS